MKKLKYTRVITCPVREEMFLQIQRICQDKDIPLSIFIREALKIKLKENSENEK